MNKKNDNFPEMLFGHKLHQDEKISSILRLLILIGFAITIGTTIISLFFHHSLVNKSLLNLLLAITLLAVFIFTEYIYKNKFSHIPTIYYYGAMFFAFLANVLGEIYNFYELFPWWDNALHFTSGILIGFTVIIIVDYYQSKLYIRRSLYKDAIFTIVIATAASISIAVFWEFFEFLVDYYLGGNMQDGFMWGSEVMMSEVTAHVLPSGRFLDKALVDTSFDQLLATLGAILSATINLYVFNYNRKRNAYKQYSNIDDLQSLSKEDLINIIEQLNDCN